MADESINVEDEEEDDFDMEGEEFDEGMDLGAILEPFLTTDEGDTICTALVAISKHMENQNKILIKILSAINSASVKKE